MHPQTYRMLAEREETYWWHQARRAMSLGLLRRHGLAAGCRWLDLGCGPGGNLRLLDALRPELVVGVDLYPDALASAHQKAPRASLVRADISRRLPFADAAFDVATTFNVLYHAWIASEADVLAEIKRLLRPGGLMLVTEPAFSILAREMDTAAMARRRYRSGEFAALCRAAGFEVVLATYFTSFGFPLLLGMKALRSLRAGWSHEPSGPSADMRPLSPTLNGVMHGLATIEARAIEAGIPMPFGTTLVCLARRP